MSLAGKQVAVIGAGIGGLAVAQALADHGAEVTVFEQADAIREIGAGIQISPNGFAVLRALGLSEDICKQSVQARAVNLIDYRGKSVTRLDLALSKQQDYHFVHRADLIDCLHNSTLSKGVKISTNHRVKSVTDGQNPIVSLTNGSSATADLVIGADGLHSVVRTGLNPESSSFFTGQVAWRATIAAEVEPTPEVRLFMGPHRHIVTYPLRRGELINLVAIQERDSWVEESWSATDDPANLRAAFHDFCPEVQDMLARVNQVHLWGLFRHAVAARWHGANTVLIGDAAHPTLPFMAQGASLALEDAWVLADTLSRGGSLAEYQARRKERASRIVTAATGNAWKYHLSNPLLRRGAHLGLKLAGQIAPRRLVSQFDWIYAHDVTRRKNIS